MAVASFKITVKGAEQVRMKLQGFKDRLRRRIIREAVHKAAGVIAAEARQLVPVGQTRKLQRSIKVRPPRLSRKGRESINSRVMAAGGAAFYGRFIHDGWKKVPTYTIGGRIYSVKRFQAKFMKKKQMPARPFMATAADNKAQEAIAVVVRSIQNELKKRKL